MNWRKVPEERTISNEVEGQKAFFYSDSSDESKRVREHLVQAGILFEEAADTEFVALSNNGFEAPVIIAKEGEYKGFEMIENYIELITNRP